MFCLSLAARCSALVFLVSLSSELVKDFSRGVLPDDDDDDLLFFLDFDDDLLSFLLSFLPDLEDEELFFDFLLTGSV